MKVTNWRKKMVAAIIAGGALSPSLCHAVSIPLGDPSFETYTVPAGFNYAYAQPTFDPADNPGGTTVGYRPPTASPAPSPWVDDLDSPISASGISRTQDDVDSNWLYNSAYAELAGTTNHLRGTPRTGNQAMHGLANYSAQKVATTFVAEKYYTFSVWAQGDADAIAADDEVALYIFNGSTPFNETTSLDHQIFQGGPTGAFINRGPTMNAAASKNNWKQITVTHVVYPGSPEIGQPIGVGFYGRRDAAVDDATLDVDDASNHLLVLEVNTTNGQVRFRNQTAGAMNIDYYDIKSAGGALNAATWSSLQQQNLAGYPAGNGSGNGWEKAGGSSSTAIGESYLTGNSSVGSSTNVGLGAAFNVAGAHDLVFEYGAIGAGVIAPTGDYNNNGVVDAA
ncbi:MAG TPA: hypothetical protein VHU84_00535, partial [Lacipirellulaceae bacterium]|nr:hypothetical protein [Lacipirellulaceae bacterium]